MPSATTTSRPLQPGVWAPIPTFFDENEDIDVPTFTAHVLHLARANVWPVICGSMGEAHHLTDDERVTLIRAARQALDENGLREIPILAGTGVGSTRGTIALCKSAAQAGADFAIVIPSGYYAGAMGREALKRFFVEVAEGSELPVMIYNFPGAAGGIDMDSDLIIDIARSSSNICGVKLTCGAVGKLTRITKDTTSKEFLNKYPRRNPNAPFLTLGGFADFMLPTVLGGKAHGAIMGLANIYPYALSQLFQASSSLLTNISSSSSTISSPLTLEQTTDLQGLASDADWAFVAVGIAGTKWFLKETRGYGGKCRRPLLELSEERGRSLMAEEKVKRFLEVEMRLQKEAGVAGVNGKANGLNGVNGH